MRREDPVTSTFEESISALSDWIGRERVVEDEIGVTTVRRIASMLDQDPAAFEGGSVLPPHWFSMFFADIARQSDIGPDGHPDKGVFLPPIPLPRRMGAGRRVQISGRLTAGQPARKTAEVANIVPEQGRTGPICILTMRHTIETAGQVVAVDEFDAIYREAVPPGQKSARTPARPAPTEAAWRESITLTSPLVFRYSAVTWNAHRIHYDAEYTRDEEGYPGAVQNGGLTMQLLTDAALSHATGELKGFTTRLTRPIYVGDTVSFCGGEMTDGRMECWVADAEGNLCALLEAEFS
jgi:3-methylfumaryl-CoA hydratase